MFYGLRILVPDDRRDIVAFTVKIEADDIACFYNIGFGDDIECRHNIPILVETHNNPITGRKRDIKEGSVDMPCVKYSI
jgi:hypothetical protein